MRTAFVSTLVWSGLMLTQACCETSSQAGGHRRAPTASPSDFPADRIRGFPCFPADQGDYRVRGCMAHVACPTGGMRRIWLKGSEDYRWVRVQDYGKPLPLRQGDHYTCVFPDCLDADTLLPSWLTRSGDVEVTVRFAATEDFDVAEEVKLRLPDPAAFRLQISKPSADFAIVNYGGFQPFSVRNEGRTPTAYVDSGDGRGSRVPSDAPQDWKEVEKKGYAHLMIRRALRDVTVQSDRVYLPGHKADELMSTPALIVGNGDQVYAEGAYHHYGRGGWKKHPISAWEAGVAKPRPRLSHGKFFHFLNIMYQRFWSFCPLGAALGSCPSVMTWDDHEIRDGWGSQGDEYTGGCMDQELAKYYLKARHAFVRHQFLRGPQGHAGTSGSSLQQELVVHGVPVFVLDLRSERGRVKAWPVIGKDQWKQFTTWLTKVTPKPPPSREQFAVIVSSVPIFCRYARLSGNASRFWPKDQHTDDDIRDGWDCKENGNQTQRDKIIALLREKRNQGLLPIILSGDYHLSAAVRVRKGPFVPWWKPWRRAGSMWRHDTEREVLAYELVCSGLANGRFHGRGQAMLRSGAPFNVVSGSTKLSVDPETACYDAVPNFGAVEFRDGRAYFRIFQTHAGKEKVENAPARTLWHCCIPLEWEGPDIEQFSKLIGCNSGRIEPRALMQPGQS